MELIIKIYSDKPSRIGVKYTYDYQAQKAYEEVIRKGGSGSYKLSLEPVRDKITLVATSYFVISFSIKTALFLNNSFW